jgi:D-arabinose 1-dehydrogenase-like Zn-dependent alcohol dehydrogenase
MKAITLQEFQEPLEVSDVEKPDLSSAGAGSD